MKYILTWVAAVFGVLLTIAFLLQGFGLVNLMFWGPKFQEARREVFEETQSFVHGKVTHINRLRLEYESTESDGRKKALRTMILQEAAVLERENLPEGLQTFLTQLESQ